MNTELISATQSLNALDTLLASANKLHNYNEIVIAFLDVKSKLLKAQEKQISLQMRNAELEVKVAAQNRWEFGIESYDLVSQENSSFSSITVTSDEII